MVGIKIGEIKQKFESVFKSIFAGYCKYVLNIERDKKWANFFEDVKYIALLKEIRHWQEEYGEAFFDFIELLIASFGKLTSQNFKKYCF